MSGSEQLPFSLCLVYETGSGPAPMVDVSYRNQDAPRAVKNTLPLAPELSPRRYGFSGNRRHQLRNSRLNQLHY
jgi:hypothetical protein